MPEIMPNMPEIMPNIMPEKSLYLMRHGETTFNLAQLSQGWCDSPLTDRGIEQAKLAAHYMRAHNFAFDYFACSTQERASDTLEIVMQELYGEIRSYRRFKGLKESYYGFFEASPIRLLVAGITKDVDAYVPFGGEPYNELQDRMEDTLSYIMQKPEVNSALVVSHMRSVISFLERITGYKVVDERELTNCCIAQLSYSDEAGFTFHTIHQTGGTTIFYD